MTLQYPNDFPKPSEKENTPIVKVGLQSCWVVVYACLKCSFDEYSNDVTQSIINQAWIRTCILQECGRGLIVVLYYDNLSFNSFIMNDLIFADQVTSLELLQ